MPRRWDIPQVTTIPDIPHELPYSRTLLCLFITVCSLMVCSTVTSSEVFHHVQFDQNWGFAPLPSLQVFKYPVRSVRPLHLSRKWLPVQYQGAVHHLDEWCNSYLPPVNVEECWALRIFPTREIWS